MLCFWSFSEFSPVSLSQLPCIEQSVGIVNEEVNADTANKIK